MDTSWGPGEGEVMSAVNSKSAPLYKPLIGLLYS